MKRHLTHPRDEIMQTMERIYRYRMTTTSGGNLSVREPNGDIWITPARLDKGNLRREHVVCVRADGTTEGNHRPSSEFPFHKAIYAARPDISAIVHAHPVALVAFSICRQSPNTTLFHQAHSVCGKVGFAPYALPGSQALAENIAKTFAQKFDSVILENHGVAVGGENLQDAFERFETFEFTAKTIIKASLLGKVRYLTTEQLGWAERHGAPLPAFTPSHASSEEKELRRQLCEFVRRGYHQRLMISTEGSFSARLDGNAFLITPSRADRHRLEPEDIVLIREGASEAGKTCSRAARIHQAIYQRHHEIRSIVNAYPVNATAFSVTDARLDTRTIPESYIFLREVQRIPFGLQFQNSDELAALVSARNPIALLEN
ncbi:MAG TPA: class II aldolase/adducin family protein, partial [Candidatus Saccharimonadales bacterium]|nr:class II aldolase/adducin family protein [Candidatus Saccharimonadales bacterium]